MSPSIAKPALSLLAALLLFPAAAPAQTLVFRDARIFTGEEMIAENTGKSSDVVSRDIERDKILTAEDALSYGLIDQIIKEQKDLKAQAKDASERGKANLCVHTFHRQCPSFEPMPSRRQTATPAPAPGRAMPTAWRWISAFRPG